MNTASQVIVITGQTATGKTQRAIALAKQKGGALICCDSRQVYRELDIVTGKDRNQLIQSGVPFYGIDLVSPNKQYASHDFAQMATELLSTLSAQGTVPIVVGGTWLYIKHLLYGFDVVVPPDYALRARLNTLSVSQLQTALQEIPHTSGLKPLNQSDSMNPHRLIRRIEILTHYHLHPTQKKGATELKARWSAQIIGYRYASRQQLVEAITNRVHKRMQEGALEETKKLLERYGETAPGMQTIGYTQLIAHLKGTLGKKEAITAWINKEVQYAKRQYTFMKQDSTITWNELEKAL